MFFLRWRWRSKEKLDCRARDGTNWPWGRSFEERWDFYSENLLPGKGKKKEFRITIFFSKERREKYGSVTSILTRWLSLGVWEWILRAWTRRAKTTYHCTSFLFHVTSLKSEQSSNFLFLMPKEKKPKQWVSRHSYVALRCIAHARFNQSI